MIYYKVKFKYEITEEMNEAQLIRFGIEPTVIAL